MDGNWSSTSIFPARFRTGRPRRGVAMLEMAIVMPILLLLVLGIIEIGRVMMLNQMTTNGCREACRRAIVPGMDHDTVMNIANDYLDMAGVSQTGRVVDMKDANGNSVRLEDIGSHEEVVIEAEVPYANNTWGFTSIMGGKKMVCRCSMRRE